jgi:hypothetical protein
VTSSCSLPGCGAGVFLSAAPADVQATWIGVERDPVTARPVSRPRGQPARLRVARIMREHVSMPGHITRTGDSLLRVREGVMPL